MEYEPCLQDEKRSSITKISGPDGLEAWFVALAACFINFVMAGLGRMSGILYVALIDIFQTDRRQASLPFSVRSSTRNLLGPVVGILGQKYGVRPVIIVGGIIGTLSAASCFYLNDIVWITVVWGGINGVGTALTTTLPLVVIGQHFEKYRTTASGMAFSGGCVGSFLFPVLIEYLLHTYELGGTFLIIAGIIMHVIPAALILKTPSWWKKKKKIKVSTINGHSEKITNLDELNSEDEVREKSVKCADKILPQETDVGFSDVNITPKNNLEYHERNSELLLQGIVDTEFLWNNRDFLIRLLTNDFTLQYMPSDIKQNNCFPTDDALIEEIVLFFRKLEASVSSGDKNLLNISKSPDSLKPDVEFIDKYAQSKHIYLLNEFNESKETLSEIKLCSINSISFYLGKIFEKDRKDILQSFPEEQHENISKMLQDLRHVYHLLESYEKKNYLGSPLLNNSRFLDSVNSIESCGEKSNTFYSHIKTALKLHTKPLFLLICLCRCVHFLTFMPVVTTVVDFSMDKGLRAEDGKYVIAALSFGDLMGRLCLGWITDRGYVTLPRYMLSVMVLQGVATVTLSFMQSSATIMTSIAVFGFLQGSVFVRHPVLVSRYLGSHEQSIAMGCINFFSGLLGFILPLYIGYFRDTIGSYNGMFYINGSIGAFIGLLWLFEPYCLRLSSRSRGSGEQQTQV